VPLTQEALGIINALALGGDKDALLFPSANGRPLSDTAVRKYLQDEMKRPNLTVHGFRSTFRDWAHEQTEVAGDIAEAALSHRTGDATELAYKRGEALDRRRKLMEMWATFCTTGAASSGAIS
jgi:integrase